MGIKLEDIAPIDAEYKLSNGKTFTVRKFDLVDNTWIEAEFGKGDSLEKALNDPINMMRVAFHQMPIEQQKQFSAIDIEEMDQETGETKKSRIGGWRLFSKEVVGPHDAQAISVAIITAMVGSSPVVDEIAKNAVSKQATAKKKPHVGVKSSI